MTTLRVVTPHRDAPRPLPQSGKQGVPTRSVGTSREQSFIYSRKFFPVIWKYRAWDYVYSLMVFRDSLHHLKKVIDAGMEVDETRLPKVAAMQRAITILDHIVADEYIELSEQELGELSSHGNQLAEQEWRELWQILAGSEDIPGSDLRGWWD